MKKRLDPKSLTLDVKSLLRMTVQDRIAFYRQGGASYFESLTPTDLAKLFPKQYLQALPDMGKALSGGTRGTTGGGSSAPSVGTSGGQQQQQAPTATPAPRTQGTQPQTQERQNTPSGTTPAASPGVKYSWQRKLDELKKQHGIQTPGQSKREEKNSSISSSISGDSPLALDRKTAAQQLTREDRIHMYALTIAEKGDKSEKRAAMLMESIYNRTFAQKKSSLRNTMGLSGTRGFDYFAGSKQYYEPLRGPNTDPRGWARYQAAKKKLESDPEYFKKFDDIHNNEVLAGSNYTNYGTHNSSLHVADSARRTQTVTATSVEEVYSRKDIEAFAKTHGIGTVRNEKAWFESVKKRMDEFYANQGNSTKVPKPSEMENLQSRKNQGSEATEPENFNYEDFYKQVGTYREDPRYSRLNITAGSKTEFGGRGTGAYGGLCGVGVSNAVGVMFGRKEFKKISNMHAGNFSMLGSNNTFEKTGLYQGKKGLSNEDFQKIRSSGNKHGYPPGTIIAVGSTRGNQHIQFWDGRRWISDTVQKDLANFRRGEAGTAAIYIPNAAGINALPKSIRDRIPDETLKTHVGISKQDLSDVPNTEADNRKNFSSSEPGTEQATQPDYEQYPFWDNLPDTFKKEFADLTDEQKRQTLDTIKQLPKEGQDEFISSLKNAPVNEQREIASQIVNAPGQLPNIDNMQSSTIVDTDLQGLNVKAEPYSRVVTNISGYSPRANRPKAAGSGEVESTSEELSILKRGIDDRGPSLGYHAAVASFFYNKDTGEKIDETAYNKLSSNQKQNYIERAEVHQLRNPTKRVASMGGVNPETGKSWNADTYALVRVGKMSPEKIRAYEEHLAEKIARGELPDSILKNIHGDGQLRPRERGEHKFVDRRGITYEPGGEGATDAGNINRERILARSKEIAEEMKSAPVRQSEPVSPIPEGAPAQTLPDYGIPGGTDTRRRTRGHQPSTQSPPTQPPLSPAQPGERAQRLPGNVPGATPRTLEETRGTSEATRRTLEETRGTSEATRRTLEETRGTSKQRQALTATPTSTSSISSSEERIVVGGRVTTHINGKEVPLSDEDRKYVERINEARREIEGSAQPVSSTPAPTATPVAESSPQRPEDEPQENEDGGEFATSGEPLKIVDTGRGTGDQPQVIATMQPGESLRVPQDGQGQPEVTPHTRNDPDMFSPKPEQQDTKSDVSEPTESPAEVMLPRSQPMTQSLAPDAASNFGYRLESPLSMPDSAARAYAQDTGFHARISQNYSLQTAGTIRTGWNTITS